MIGFKKSLIFPRATVFVVLYEALPRRSAPHRTACSGHCKPTASPDTRHRQREPHGQKQKIETGLCGCPKIWPRQARNSSQPGAGQRWVLGEGEGEAQPSDCSGADPNWRALRAASHRCSDSFNAHLIVLCGCFVSVNQQIFHRFYGRPTVMQSEGTFIHLFHSPRL